MEIEHLVIISIVFFLELFWFVQLIHLMSREDSYFLGKYDKPCWVAVLLVANWVGALAYIFLKPFNTYSETKDIRARAFIKMPNAPKSCPKCGESSFYNAQSCLACGWTYEEPDNIEKN